MKKKRKKKRLRKWSSETLTKLNDRDFIEVFVTAITDRTILKTSSLEFENKIKHGAPKHSIKLLLKEAKRRNIPLSKIAERFTNDAFSGNSFIRDLCAPASWKRYEIHAAGALLTLLESENVDFGSYEFDARIIGKITKRERQVDLLLVSEEPRHVVACEFRHYKEYPISIDAVEAFKTKLNDINANKGVMLTPHGYQSGAKATADHYKIVLFTFKEIKGDELLRLQPEKSSMISVGHNYWILEKDNKISWVFGGTLTEKAREK